MSSLDKMLSLLDLFDESCMSIGLEEAMSQADLSQATAYRYLQSLCQSGLLSPANGGRYVLGTRIIEFDRLLRRNDPLLRSAHGKIKDFGTRLSVNVMLCAYYGDKVMCSDQFWIDSRMAQLYERGKSMPMFRGAMAKTILANLTPYQMRNMMLWHADQIRESGLGTDWDEFRKTMAKLRDQRVCITRGEVFPKLVGIGAPIFDAETRVLGSIVFIVDETTLDAARQESLSEEILALAEEITNDIAKLSPEHAGGDVRAARPRKSKH
ncbi:IclR family transcriptional regulator [Devosia naphthalenivorans]|uniref:IclR family transcriptional regulator n=1 Tax=Devosia naphthalenivorans TaxID=2082392 RepID=UPI000D3BC80D|nr:IclR family transcriptional regulator C-terminal domain-containing protein [Devosia naphthalenivorans]